MELSGAHLSVRQWQDLEVGLAEGRWGGEVSLTGMTWCQPLNIEASRNNPPPQNK